MKKKQAAKASLPKQRAGATPTLVVWGLKYLRLVGALLEALHEAGTERDQAGNRQLVYDQDATLLLLYFFTSTVTNLRGVQQLSTLSKVQARWGVRRTAVGTLSEAASVFDAALLQDVLSELALRAWTQGTHEKSAGGAREQELLRDLVAIDGSLLPALPRMVWALWQDDRHRAAKMHLAFAAVRQGPVGGGVTPGNSSQRAPARPLVQPGGVFVFDRGFVDFDFFPAWPSLPPS